MQLSTLGDFRLIKRIAKGGMGEIYQAFDTRCRRYVALKKIREDLKNYQGIRTRFLNEAHIAASLWHPSIVPIFTIQAEEDPLYYTMPLLEGQSLKALISQARKDPHLLSVNQAVSFFLNLAHGLAHAHSRGVLHRDIKAENIWIGTAGECVILDWGVAKFVSDIGVETLYDELIDAPASASNHNLTRPGKVVGTLAYMAPERALRKEVSYSSDIYSLGVLLYYMLTFHLPFQRKTLKEYVKIASEETYIDLTVRAPFRDIPRDLARIIDRCLKFDHEQRYLTVHEVIEDVQAFLSSGSDWIHHAELAPQVDANWTGKEWVYLTTPVAQSESLHPEPMGWVTRMISREHFEGNLKIRLEIKSKDDVTGLGLLLCAPQHDSSHRALEGYCIWIGPHTSTCGQLLRNGVMVMDLPGFCFSSAGSHQLTIEKIDNSLHCYFDHAPKMTYVSYLPLVGSHVGLVVPKGHYDMVKMHVFGGKHSLQISCLAVPDAFLAQKMYRQALAEYRRIGQSFFDYLEGRQAIFRAGVTLIEWSRQRPDPEGAKELLDLARDEFQKLKGTLSAPLEWLGKSLVYREMGLEHEEMNALELACLRFKDHPLVGWIHEEVVFRLHQQSSETSALRCRLVMLIARALPHFVQRRDVLTQFRQVLGQMPGAIFWQSPKQRGDFGQHSSQSSLEGVVIRMAYYLDDDAAIVHVLQDLSTSVLAFETVKRLVHNGIYALLWMNRLEEAKAVFDKIASSQTDIDGMLAEAIFAKAHRFHQKSFARSFNEVRLGHWLSYRDWRLQQETGMLGENFHILFEACSQLSFQHNSEKEWFYTLGMCALGPGGNETSMNMWLTKARSAPFQEDVYAQFFIASAKLQRGLIEQGFHELSAMRHLPSHHPLALLEAWVHRKLLSLSSWMNQALLCEKQQILDYGKILLWSLHRSNPVEAERQFLRLSEAKSYE